MFEIVTIFILSIQPLYSQPPEIPMRDFFKNPEKAVFQLSPDGNYISFVAPYEHRMNIHIQKRGSVNVKRITSVTDRDIWTYLWKGNERILFLKDKGGDENYHIFATDLDGDSIKDLTPFDSVQVRIVDELKENDTDILIEMNKRLRQVFDVYRLNTLTGELKPTAENPGNITGWITDHDGNIRAALTTDGVNTRVLFRETTKDTFSIILTTTFKDKFQPLFFTFDNQNLFALSNIGRDKSAIVEFNPRTAKEIKVIYEHPEVDLGGMDYSRLRKVLTTINFTTWKFEIKILDKETEKIYAEFQKKFNGYNIYISAHNLNEDIFIVDIFNDKVTVQYFLYEKDKNRITLLADATPWLKEQDLADMKPISYTARDGLTIHGYLTLPKGEVQNNLPVIIYPHGGPWWRDDWQFRPDVQFLANRGYAVLQMNFRISTGYGKEFWMKGFKQWGRAMQDDITDGVRWLIDQGIADPKRIGIYGGSYGGYATLAGLAFTPDLYACGVDFVGVSNLFTFLNSLPPYWEPYRQMWYERIGDPKKDSAMLAAVSPVFHVDRIKAPLFVAQGANDPRVNINESNQIVDALRKRGVEVEYLVKENEGHGFGNEENLFDFYEKMEKFLDKHLKKRN
jgi:dipeptidyl aminopeptidase/acylaminoacyl peptidase